ncbi:conserved exported hypothetical protein [Burkholderiales bacterium 8X]|nr:conserved exported hypothetical protein [Burkholderiales bacterium 8X]
MTFTACKNLFAAMLLAACSVAGTSAIAHGVAPARHGGVVQGANDLSFELVAAPDGAIVYVVDHDNEYATRQMSGKLTVLNGAEKSEADLKSAGGNKLEARGVKLGRGAKVVAVVTDGPKTMTVRFAVK